MLKEKIIKFALFLCAFVSVIVSFAIMLTILIEALKFFQKESVITFLFSSQWAADAAFMNADGTSKQGVFGALSLFWGTFYIYANGFTFRGYVCYIFRCFCWQKI